MISRLLAGGIAATLLLGATPALAGNVQALSVASIFSQCDGYGLPSSGGDGMTEYANILGMFNPPGYGTTDRTQSQLGEQGVAACDAALADNRLLPAFWMRKVSLLRARAMHQLERDDFAAAIRDLDAAGAAIATPDDAFFNRSLGLGLDLVRAYTLQRQGQTGPATAMALKAWETRPYNRGTALAAMIALGPDSESKEAEQLMYALARYQPTTLDQIYIRMLDEHRWAEALALYPQLRAPGTRKTYGQGINSLTVTVQDTFKDGMYRISRAGSQAYVLALSGQPAEARAQLATAASTLAEAVVAPAYPPMRRNGKPPAPDVIARYEGEVRVRARLKRDGDALLTQWKTLVEQRILVSQGRIAQVVAELVDKPLPRDRFGEEILDAMLAKAPPTDTTTVSTLRGLKRQLTLPPSGPSNFGLDLLYECLPAAETVKRLPRYKAVNTSFLSFSMDGFTVEPKDEAFATTNGGPGARIDFRGVSAPASVVEEMAVLRAADMARSMGKTGFIILGREDVKYTVTTTYYGSPVRSDPNGFDTSILVVFVDLADLPALYRGTPWRVIDANAVYAALAPIYVRPETPKKR